MDVDTHHSYDEACRLAPVKEPQPDDALLDGIPPINAQFFYHSLIPIDDPLSTATIAPASDSKSAKGILRVFSHADNNALERAWLDLASSSDRATHRALLRKTMLSPALATRNAQKLGELVQGLARKHKEKHAHENQPRTPQEQPSRSTANTSLPVCCQELLIDASTMLRETFCEVSRRKQRALDQESVVENAMAIMAEKDQPSPVVVPARMVPSAGTPPPRAESFVIPGLSTSSRGRASSLASNTDASRSASTDSRIKRLSMASTSLPKSGLVPVRPPVVDDGISGKPFLRVGDSGSKPPAEPAVTLAGKGLFYTPQTEAQGPEKTPQADRAANETFIKDRGAEEGRRRAVEVAVGVSRLHMVSLPALQMKPIYWSPVNDIAIVSRATWFYRDTMFPVEPTVANQLEAGYRELRPFSQTWNDETRCAVDVGADGEEKVSHPLWPEYAASVPGNLDEQEAPEPKISSDLFCAAHCFHGEAAAQGTIRPVKPQVDGPAKTSSSDLRMYATYHVIYKDGNSAFLLKPSLKPSAYYGRRPVAKIVKGLTVGIPVVRGFSRSAWDALHEKKTPTAATKASRATASASYIDRQPHPGLCPGCEAEKAKGRVTDLVFVAHGIGQKFAERVESFHFTHAVTAFRRSINIELGSDTVKPALRNGFSGIMVLPLNWRHTLSLDDGGPMTEDSEVDATSDGFTLKDIEPGTIPAVRGLISDVMFDIPFYMSHHKPKMIQALVTEANRVYRLWCRNNPEFLRNRGRVHLIAHSLGSVMALEVLSKQPDVPPPLDLDKPAPEALFFEFDTTNLFLLGSPAGFFLLLERGSLVPRRGRRKPGAETSDTVAKDVVGGRGCFGCLAVDNIYNILAKEDPIAYLLNGTIDPMYAASLKVAHVPSTATSWLKSMGEAMRGLMPVTSSAPIPNDPNVPALTKPPAFRLPSQLELEVHDFTREEVAERKAFLLNDNGQVDFYLRSGTGPLEIQYLNMLSAHTSYWTRMDLVRLLCIEIGREPGRANALPAMRAVKLTRRDRRSK